MVEITEGFSLISRNLAQYGSFEVFSVIEDLEKIKSLRIQISNVTNLLSFRKK
jgi:hypothetical protein